jgi:hypothetical protein
VRVERKRRERDEEGEGRSMPPVVAELTKVMSANEVERWEAVLVDPERRGGDKEHVRACKETQGARHVRRRD